LKRWNAEAVVMAAAMMTAVRHIPTVTRLTKAHQRQRVQATVQAFPDAVVEQQRPMLYPHMVTIGVTMMIPAYQAELPDNANDAA
jgi:hypothetical protein